MCMKKSISTVDEDDMIKSIEYVKSFISSTCKTMTQILLTKKEKKT